MAVAWQFCGGTYALWYAISPVHRDRLQEAVPGGAGGALSIIAETSTRWAVRIFLRQVGRGCELPATAPYSNRRVDAQSAFLQRLLTPPPFYPPVEIPFHLMRRVKDCGRRERLVLWWLVYRLPIERIVDDAAIAEAAAVARWDVTKIAEIQDASPVH